jgi:anhydro-N-acetylmuramic acid kinase
MATTRDADTRYGIGLMSGSSCDGVDAALVRLRGSGSTLQVSLTDFATTRYPTGFRTRLLAPHTEVRDVCCLNFELGEHLAAAAAAMRDKAREKGVEPDFVASHGHTVAHVPPRNGARERGTLQVGEAALIAEATGLPVVSNFRVRDMAVGGQGAPLVPYADWLLFHRDDRTVACLNIGGIANVTVVPPNREDVLAFDTGPGNMPIDGAIRLLSKGERSIDEGGEAAGAGAVVDEFLEYLLDHPYFKEPPPKSTGREEFGPEVYLRDALAARRRHHPLEDLVATVTEAVARSIAEALRAWVLERHDLARVIVSGGGAHNRTLMRRLDDLLPETMVVRSERYHLPVDAREAVAFAILGGETLAGLPGNVPGATGAGKAVVLGTVTPA